MAIGRSSMGKELTGNRRVRKFATGGTAATASTPITNTKSGGYSYSPFTKDGPRNTVTDPKTGDMYDAPKYSGYSFKGLTSDDPANVARNREAAARYAAMPSSNSAGGNNGTANGVLDAMKGGASTTPQINTPKTKRIYQPPPADYKPGKDPEWNYFKTVPVKDKSADKPAPAKKAAGGKVKAGMRGCGCATRGLKGGKMK